MSSIATRVSSFVAWTSSLPTNLLKEWIPLDGDALAPVAVVGQAMATAVLPALSQLLSEGRRQEFDRVFLQTLRAALGLAVLAAGVAIALAEPIVTVVFQRGHFTAADTGHVTWLLQVLAFAVPAWVVQQIAVRGFYSRRDMWRPMLLGTAVALAAIPLYLELGRRYGAAGLAAHASTAAAHLRTLTRDFGVRLLDVPTGTPPGPNPEISRQSTNLHALATRRGEPGNLPSTAAAPSPTASASRRTERSTRRSCSLRTRRRWRASGSSGARRGAPAGAHRFRSAACASAPRSPPTRCSSGAARPRCSSPTAASATCSRSEPRSARSSSISIERKPPPLHARTLEVAGRVGARGEVVEAFDAAAARAALEQARAAGIPSVAIALIHAYAYPEFERRLRELAEAMGFGHVVASHEIAREMGLLARGETTSVDAYLTPLLRAHVTALREALPGSRLRLMQSSGGLTDAERFRAPHALLSGPAGGVVGAARVAPRRASNGPSASTWAAPPPTSR